MSNLVHGLVFGTLTFYIAPSGKIKCGLINPSYNCDVKSSIEFKGRTKTLNFLLNSATCCSAK